MKGSKFNRSSLEYGLDSYQSGHWSDCIRHLETYLEQTELDIQKSATEITLKKARARLADQTGSLGHEQVSAQLESTLLAEADHTIIYLVGGEFGTRHKGVTKKLRRLIRDAAASTLVLDPHESKGIEGLALKPDSIFISGNQRPGGGSINIGLCNSILANGQDNRKLSLLVPTAWVSEELLELCQLSRLTEIKSFGGVTAISLRFNHVLLNTVGFFVPFEFSDPDLFRYVLLEYLLRAHYGYCMLATGCSPCTQVQGLKAWLSEELASMIAHCAGDQDKTNALEYLAICVSEAKPQKYIPFNIRILKDLGLLGKNAPYANLTDMYSGHRLYVTSEFQKAVGASVSQLRQEALGNSITTVDSLLPNSVAREYDIELVPLKLDFNIDYERFVQAVVPPIPPCFLWLRKPMRGKYVQPKDASLAVLMSFYNAADTVWYAIFSLALQLDHPDEILIGDDNSNIQEQDVLAKIKWLYPCLPVRLISSDENIGTYGIRNLLVTECSSSMLVINDSDDFSMRTRLARQLSCLAEGATRAVYSNHVRVKLDGSILGRIVEGGGVKQIRPALASMLYEKSLHVECGYYYPARKGSDSAFHAELSKYEAVKKHNDIVMLQYVDSHRGEQLTSDMYRINRKLGCGLLYAVERAPERERMAAEYSALPPQSLRRPQIRLGKPRMVIGNMATIPERRETLGKVLKNILPQVDRFNLYLNNYPDSFDFWGEFKELLPYKSSLRVTTSQEIGERRELARFFHVKEYGTDWYYACFDDDIIYPTDYVDRLYVASQRYRDKVALCVHGYSLWDGLYDFTSDKARAPHYHHFMFRLSHDAYVDVAGVGTLFCPAEFLGSSFEGLETGFNDLRMCEHFYRQSVPIVALGRREEWLVGIRYEKSNYKASRLGLNSGRLFAQQLCDSIGVWDRDFRAQTEERSLGKSLSINSLNARSLSRIQDQYPVFVCATGRNAEKCVSRFCENLRLALSNVFSNKVSIVIYEDASTDSTAYALRKEMSSRLGRYDCMVIPGGHQVGPAIGRALLLNRIRKLNGKKLICMLDLDDAVTPLFGRYVSGILEQGYCDVMFCGGWSFRGGEKKRHWKAPHGSNGESVESLLALPFSWGHPRMWWESTNQMLDLNQFKVGYQPLMYSSDVAFLKGLLSTLPSGMTIQRSYEELYHYYHDHASGTISKYGQKKRAMARYLLNR